MSMSTSIIYGYGSELKKSKNIRAFILNHGDTIKIMSEKGNVLALSILKYFEDDNNVEQIYELFEDYESHNCEYGLNGIIADIISEETNIRVEYRNGQDDGKEYIIFPETMPWWLNDIEKTLTEESLNEIFERYFKELKIPCKYGDIKLEYFG